jgi:hypothetical protein
MAAASEKAEFILGELLTFSGVVDAGIRIIDQYSRWEVLVSLQEHVWFLAHPAAPMILLIAGLILIQRSMQRTFARSLKEGQESHLHDESGNKIVIPVAPPRIATTLLVVFAGVIVAGICAVAWIMSYSPKPPTLITKIEAPAICKTADCFPAKPKSPGRQTSVVINAPGGIPIVDNRGTVINPTVNNFAPLPRRLSDSQKSELAECLRKKAGRFSIMAIQNNSEAYRYAQDWREVFISALWEIAHKDIPIHIFEIGGGMWSGMRISVHDTSPVQGQIALADDSPEQNLDRCLIGRTDIPTGAQIIAYKDRPSGSAVIEISDQPRN